MSPIRQGWIGPATARAGCSAQLNQDQEDRLGHPETVTRITQYELAYRMQIAVPEVMDISREPAAALAQYGVVPGSFANNCLLARRLVENGCCCSIKR